MCEPVGEVMPPPAAPDGFEHPVRDPDGGVDPGILEVDDLLAGIDRAYAQVVSRLIGLGRDGVCERDLGVPLEQHLAIDALQIRSDRRMLLLAADVLATMPATHALFADGRLSWGQIRVIVTACRGLRRDDRREVDDAIATNIDDYGGADPDALLWQVEQLACDLDPREQESREEHASETNHLWLQPRLTGGGVGGFDYSDPVMFAEVAERLDQLARRHLDGSVPTSKDSVGGHDDGAARQAARTLGRARASALHELCTLDPLGSSLPRPPRVQLVAPFASLLDQGQTPGWLLTRLTGGRMRLSAAYARRLIDERGADITTVVVEDHGHSVGVGTRRRFAPEWLKSAVRVEEPTCTFPGCATASRVSQADHSVPASIGGPADLDHLSHACSSHHGLKTRGIWVNRVRPDGVREWRNVRSGWTGRYIPATRPFTKDPPQRVGQPPLFTHTYPLPGGTDPPDS